MDDRTFDALVRSAQRGSSRRGVLRTAVGTLATAAFGLAGWNAAIDVAAKKKHKSKKKKQRCQKTCFDRCVSGGAVCCDGPADGSGGACEHPGYPHCCAAAGPTGGGCCEAGYPVCCSDAQVGEYCCPAGTVCCSTSITGCCPSAAQDQEATAHSASRGQWHQGSSKTSGGSGAD